MGSGGSMGGGGAETRSAAMDTNAYGGPGGGGSPGYVSQANTPEMRTYKDPAGNTVRVYATSYGGGLNEAHGYKEVYSPTGRLISSTKPQAAANSAPPPVNPYRRAEVK